MCRAATFARFCRIADGRVSERAHEALIERTLKDHLIGHIARDATAIEAREKPDRRENRRPRPQNASAAGRGKARWWCRRRSPAGSSAK